MKPPHTPRAGVSFLPYFRALARLQDNDKSRPRIMNASSKPSDDRPSLKAVVLDWFVRRQREGWSAADEVEFQAWRTSDAQRQAAYARWEANWEALDAVPAAAVAVLRSRLASDKATQQAAAHRPARAVSPGAWGACRLGAMPAFATAIVLAVVIATGMLGWNHWSSGAAFAQVYSTDRGQQVEATLPDGSRVRLDTATRLEVRFGSQHREVRLVGGQAVFDVEPETGRPFQVLAGPVKVTVVGTLFSVRHTPDVPGGAGARIAVEHGRVRVTLAGDPVGAQSQAAADSVLLTAGQQVEADARGALSATTSILGDGIAPWRANRVSFVDVPLSTALAEFERYGSTGLIVRDPAVATLRLSGTFDPRDIRTLRRLLPGALPVRLHRVDGDTEIVLAR